MANEVFSKVQERIEILELYSEQTMFSAQTDDVDATSALLSFDCWNLPELREKLVFIIDRLVSFRSREYVLAGLNFDRHKNDAQSFDQRLEALADRYGVSLSQAKSFWKGGIALICNRYEVGVKLFEANALIVKSATSSEAAAAISWLVTEYIRVNRES